MSLGWPDWPAFSMETHGCGTDGNRTRKKDDEGEGLGDEQAGKAGHALLAN